MAVRRSVRSTPAAFAVAAVLGAVLIATVALPPSASAATGPTVKAGHHDGVIAVPGGTFGTMVTLPLPAGAWFVTAKAVVSGTSPIYGHYGVTCRLVAGADFDDVSAAPLQIGSEGVDVPIFLTVVHRFNAPGNALLRCVAETPGTVAIRLIRISALKVGTLTNGPLGGAATTTGTGSPRVISGFRDATIDNSSGLIWNAVGRLYLPTGRWWIQAKVILGGGPGPAASTVECGFLASDGGIAAIDYDVAKIGLSPIGSAGDHNSLGLQVVAGFNSVGSFANLDCRATGEFKTSWVKITAVKLGKTTYRQLPGGHISTTGTGPPRVIHGADSGPVGLIATNDYMTVRSMTLPAGKWAVSAKLWLHDTGGTDQTSVLCRLVLGTDRGTGQVMMQGSNTTANQPMYLQVDQSIGSSSEVKLRCKRTTPTVGVTLNYIRITALKADSLADPAL